MKDRPRILIIDDDPVQGRTLADILEIKGFEPLLAGNGTEGLALLRQKAVCLALIDLMLPDISGLKVLESIKTGYPSTDAIILTGNATLDSAVEAANRGAFSYLIKPYDMDQLLLLIRRAIEKQQAQEALRLSEERFRGIFELGPLGMAIIGLDNRYFKVNNTLCRMSGYSEQELASLTFMDITHPEDVEMTGQSMQRLVRRDTPCCKMEKRWIRKNGDILWVCPTVSLIRDDGGTPVYYLEMIEDITDRKRYEEQLEYQSNHDELTGLPNRNLLVDRIRQALHHAQRYHRQVAILFVDLDHFKFINDSLGHDSGDRLLKIIAERLTESVRSGDSVARQGGDDFVVVLSDMAKGEDAANVVQKIQAVICRPVNIDDHELEVTCSIGISVYPKDGSDVQTLLKNADVAMYRAKEQGRNTFQFYMDELNEKAMARMTMEKHLRRALERDEFLLHYQPQADLVTGRITGLEALLRWQSPELGHIPPARFIPLAEETGLIVTIGEWVLRTACAQNRAWQDAGLPPLLMAVNVSPRQFRREGFAGTVARVLRETGLDARYLELEIVESLVMHDVDSAAAILRKFKELGVHLTMDDFGTGYSSLSYLKRFPFDKMKIDRSFINDITGEPEGAAMADTIIAMARNLNLRVIAEGVETAEQLEFLLFHGCDEMQGFYFSRPLPARDIEQMLRENRSLPLSLDRCSLPERTILLVDDEEDVVVALERVLSDCGYHVLTASGAAQGFALLAVNRVGVILCDQRMPGMCGTDFLARVKHLYPETIRILLTAYGDQKTITDALNRGSIFKFVSKPWQPEALDEVVREAFRCYNPPRRTDRRIDRRIEQ